LTPGNWHAIIEFTAITLLESLAMLDLRNVRSLTEFQRNAKSCLRRMKRTGRPEVLTVNGKAALVVQDAESYQKLLDAIEHAEAVEGIRRGLKAIEEGRTYPVREAFDRIRRKYGIPHPHQRGRRNRD
jgi:PHD/YefM family antitoxin component YafN of YafNO toxin-antitoxin module